MEEGEESAAAKPGTTAAPFGEAAEGKTSPGESRTRKKVTFDLDLQVHTIPNRIPIYERRPAGSTAHARPQQHPLAFVPRPLDLKGKDRYLLGATTTKKIIDLFSLPNGFPSYPMPPKNGAKRVRPQGGSAQAQTNASNPYYTFANFRTSKISRAAMNLKQITAALGEHFDSSVYKEWESSKRVQASLPSSASAASRHGARSAGSIVNELGMSQSRRVGGGNAIAAFNPSRLRINPHHQQCAAGAQSQKPTLSPSPPRGYHSAHMDIPSSPLESWDRQRLPSVTSEQISLNSRSQAPRKRSAATDSPSYHRRRAGSPMETLPGEGETTEMLVPGRDRPSSRCSTIETYVISDIPGARPGSNPTGAGLRSVGSSSGHRRVIVGPNSRPVAWEAGIAIPITEPVLNVSAVRTATQDGSHAAQDGSNFVQWQVTARQPNLST